MKFLEALAERTLFFDGAMGTQLMEKGLTLQDIPETWNILKPDIIRGIHESYLRSGAHVIQANTFGLNRFKLEGTGYTVEQLTREALKIVNEALDNVPTDMGRGFCALDIGSTGHLMEPLGDLGFEEAYDVFKDVILAARGQCDLILIETMNDPYEMKAAALAAKDNSDLPVAVTMTVDESGRLFTGGSCECAIAMLEGLGVDVIGLNCSLGPEEMLKILPNFVKYCSKPILVSPNAGLPRIVHGKAIYDIGPERFARLQEKILAAGVQALGGCCGTTPSHIRRMTEICRPLPRKKAEDKGLTLVSSYGICETVGQEPKIIGERLNPTGKKKLKNALKNADFGYLQQEALRQEKQGAHFLDVNVGLPEINEPETMEKAIRQIQRVCRLPLQIDTSDPAAMERALRIYNGKPLINSVNGKQEVMDAVFPLVRRYGGVVVALTLDENGIPDTAEGRFAIAEKIIREAEKYGISRKDIVVDTLTLTISTGNDQAGITLDALEAVRTKLGVGTVLGVSNVSFGLPNRELINSYFYTMAMERGLSLGIINPGSALMRQAYDAFRALHGMDENLKYYLENYSDETAAAAVKKSSGNNASPGGAWTGFGPIGQAILQGLDQAAREETRKALETREALEIIDRDMIPALNEAGAAFESGRFFLPQLLTSAAAAQAAFSVIREVLPRTEESSKGRIILATVQGDIHDIGKNIVRILLENYGFDVLDLGKDVAPEMIVETAKREQISLIGLSALMTTTVANMATTVRMLKEEIPQCRVMVGGAALTEEYAASMKADFYSKDAMGAVRYAEQFFHEKA